MPSATRAPRSAREALLKAATTSFLASGYDAVSLDQIADAGGVARRTIYNQFASKEALFRAVIEELEESFSLPLPLANDGLMHDPRRSLTVLAHDTLRSLYKLTTVAFMPMAITQNPSLQSAVQELYGRSHARIIDGIVPYLRGLQGIPTNDLKLAAHQFVGLFSEELIWSRVIGGRGHASLAHTDATIDQAVEVFLTSYSETRILPDGKSVSPN